MTSQATESISCARERVEQEQARTRAEEHAFQRFHTRVADIDCGRSQTKAWMQPTNQIRALSDTEPDETTVEQIKDAFQATLLNTPHYDDEYDDSSIYESITAEFDPSIAHVLKQNVHISTELQTTILDAAEQAHRDRTTFLEWLDREATSLATAHDQLSEINAAVSELVDPPIEDWSNENITAACEQLQTLEHDCDVLANQRQAFLNELPPMNNLHLDAKDFDVYLYHSYDFTHPVLFEITTCIGRIQRLRGWIEQSLTGSD